MKLENLKAKMGRIALDIEALTGKKIGKRTKVNDSVLVEHYGDIICDLEEAARKIEYLKGYPVDFGVVRRDAKTGYYFVNDHKIDNGDYIEVVSYFDYVDEESEAEEKYYIYNNDFTCNYSEFASPIERLNKLRESFENATEIYPDVSIAKVMNVYFANEDIDRLCIDGTADISGMYVLIRR